MHCFSVATLSLVALIAPVFASLTTPMQTAPSYQGTTLRPIKPAEYEASMGIRRRGSKDLSSMDPRNHTHLIYGNTKGRSSSGSSPFTFNLYKAEFTNEP